MAIRFRGAIRHSVDTEYTKSIHVYRMRDANIENASPRFNGAYRILKYRLASCH